MDKGGKGRKGVPRPNAALAPAYGLAPRCRLELCGCFLDK